jgi:hypothetical protein
MTMTPTPAQEEALLPVSEATPTPSASAETREAVPSQAAREAAADMMAAWDGSRAKAASFLRHGGMDAHEFVQAFARFEATIRSEPASVARGVEELSFQAKVQPWLMACFGEVIAGDREERNHRFLEEALELVQSLGCTASEAHQLVDYVYGRPVGDPPQEVGGVMVTLAALCLANDLDMHAAGWVELNRIWGKVEAIRAKQAAKPKHSPLPELTHPSPPVLVEQEREAVAGLRQVAADLNGRGERDVVVASEEHGFDLEAMSQYADRILRLVAALLPTDVRAAPTEAQNEALHQAALASGTITHMPEPTDARAAAVEQPASEVVRLREAWRVFEQELAHRYKQHDGRDYPETCNLREAISALAATPAASPDAAVSEPASAGGDGVAGCPECGFNTCLCDDSPNNPDTHSPSETGSEEGAELRAKMDRAWPAFHEALAKMREVMEAHPFWHKARGTPLENDLPVRAAEVALGMMEAALHPTPSAAPLDRRDEEMGEERS